MRIYIKTPLFRNSQAVPQLVEHCIGHNVWLLADFFEYAYGVEKEHSPEYTMFEYDDRIPYPDAMKKLLYPLQKKAFLYEKKILQEEMGDTSYDQKIYEQLVQYLVNTTISLNSAKSLFRKEVVSYHQKRYQPEQMLVVDNDYKVLYQGYKAPAHTTQGPDFFSFPFTFEGDQYLVIGAKYCNAESYRELYFLFWMLCFHSVYQLRRKQRQYYHGEPYFHTFEHCNWVVIPITDFTSLHQQFFAYGKKYLLQMIIHGYFKERFFLNQYFYGIPASREIVIEKYKKFGRTDFNTYLQKILKITTDYKK